MILTLAGFLFVYRRRQAAFAEAVRKRNMPLQKLSSSKRTVRQPLPPFGAPPKHARLSFAELLSDSRSTRAKSATPLAKAAAAISTPRPSSLPRVVSSVAPLRSEKLARQGHAETVNFVENPIKRSGKKVKNSDKK